VNLLPMKFSPEEKREDRDLDVLTDEENGLRIIVSIGRGIGQSRAYQRSRAMWTGFLYRTTIFPHRLRVQPTMHCFKWILSSSVEDGEVFTGVAKSKEEITGSFAQRHGAWRDSPAKRSGASLKYRITPEDFLASEYPLKVGVDLTYSMDNNKLIVFFEFRNHEPELTAHVAFGLHPGFGATSFESFHLQMPRGCYRRYFSPGNYLSGETRDIEFPGGEMPFSKDELPGSIILELVDVRRRNFSYVDPPSGRWMTLDLPACRPENGLCGRRRADSTAVEAVLRQIRLFAGSTRSGSPNSNLFSGRQIVGASFERGFTIFALMRKLTKFAWQNQPGDQPKAARRSPKLRLSS
jgi:hypothetical protein